MLIESEFAVYPDSDATVLFPGSVDCYLLFDLEPMARDGLGFQFDAVAIVGLLVEVVEVEGEVAAFAPHVTGRPTVADRPFATGIGIASGEPGELATLAKVEAFFEEYTVGESIGFAGGEPFAKLSATLMGTEGTLWVSNTEALALGFDLDGGTFVEPAEEGVAPVLAKDLHLVGAGGMGVEVDAYLISRLTFLARLGYPGD